MGANLQTDNAFFTVSQEGNILLIRTKKEVVRHMTDLDGIAAFFKSLENITSCDSVKAAIFFGAPDRSGGAEILDVYRLALASRREDYVLQRLFNVVNNFVAKLAALEKITISAEQGRVDAFFLNLSLACDYRIVTEEAVYENPGAELGLVSKGGGGYFMSRMFGTRKAGEVMLRSRMLPEEALRLGLADRVVPAAELEETALRVAKSYLSKPVAALLNVRKLLKGDQEELRRSLELEDLLILNRVNSPDFPPLLEKALASQEAS
jgi:2-(1,2-epoxy-1,2-dihydrophenyl)acetyl-CoA isomerase